MKITVKTHVISATQLAGTPEIDKEVVMICSVEEFYSLHEMLKLLECYRDDDDMEVVDDPILVQAINKVANVLEVT